VAHYAASWVLTEYGLREAFSPTVALLLALIAVVVFALAAPRVPTLPWSPRTGWARRPVQKRWASSAA
jgi:hypothetical protein